MSENETSCEVDRLYVREILRYVNITVAVAIWVVFSFFQRRVSFYKTSCKGIPGIVYPLDPIHTSSHRIVYLVAYGAVAGEVVNLILVSASGDTSGGIRSIWAASLISLLNVLEASVIYLPLFACVDAPIPVVGYLTGILFVPLLFSRQIVSLDVLCRQERNDTFYEFQLADDLAFTLPILIFLSIMFVWYLVSAVREFHRLIVTPHSLVKALFEHKGTLYHVKRVRSLLARRPLRTTRHTWVHRLLSFLYPYDSNVQLPLRFLAAVVIMIYAVYLLTVTLAFFTVTLSISLGHTFDLAKEFSYKLDVSSTVITKALDYGADALYAFRVIFPAGPIIAFVWNLVIMMLLVRTVHIHFQKIARGDRSFITLRIPSPSYRLLNSIKYTSFQIAFFVWSWILACFLVWVVGVAGLVLYYLFQFWRDKILLSIATIMIPVLYSLILNYGELLLVKLLFVGDTDNRHTVLRNRRLFYLFSYFVFFQNVVIGLVFSFLRIIYSMVLGLLLFFRLDRVVLMKGFEALDQGHVTYVSFLYLEHTQNNSILMVFKDIFVELTNNTGSHPEMKELSDDPKERLYHSYSVNTFHRAPLSKRARNRWLVAYTLLRNPTLQPLRARSYDLVDKK
ncbi:hypothetical protein EMCRGX_G022232 [Ephydatia muelleri]